MTNSIQIHSSLQSVTLATPLGCIAVQAKWKQTANQTRKERAVCIPMECVKAPEVPEAFRALVERVLLDSAENVLKDYVESNPDSWEAPAVLFDRPNLVQSTLEGRTSNWMSKEQLELAFTASATWKRISSKPEFTSNKTYQMAAGIFRDCVLKLSGKTVKLTPEKCDAILSKLDDSDLETPFGEFVVGRLVKMKAATVDDFDLSSL